MAEDPDRRDGVLRLDGRSHVVGPGRARRERKPLWMGDKGGKGGHGGTKGAPGPIAGAGLPVLLVAGGYALVRRYRNRRKDELLRRRESRGTISSGR